MVHMWKVKEIKELLKNKHDEDVVQFLTYNPRSEGYTNSILIGKIDTRKPKRNEFDHEDCKYCEEITIKGNKKLYCCKDDDILHDDGSCNRFQHKRYELEYLE